MSKTPLPSKTDAALIFTNDDFLDVSRTIHYLGMACRRIQVRPFVRDVADDKWLNVFLEEKNVKDATDIAHLMINSKYIPFLYYAGIDRIVSFDAHWLLKPECFLELEPLKYIVAFWRNDLRNISAKKIFSKEKTQKELLGHPKVHHFLSSTARLKEAQRLEFSTTSLFKPAAPSEFLSENNECLHKDRMAFLPTFNPTPPSPAAIETLKQNATLESMRQIAKEEILKHPLMENWKSTELQIHDLIVEITESKIKSPYESATDLIFQKESQYPRAVEKLHELDALLDASALVKSVLKYDMPLIVSRLYRQGNLDVFGEEKLWKPYGISSKGNIKSRDIASFYQSYIAYFFAPNNEQEETLHEQLFEIAACSRSIFALNNPDLKGSLDFADEINIVDNPDQLKQMTLEKLKDPERLFAQGENVRKKISNAHTWEHRLKEVFKA